jgi:hypothetical protein
MNLPIQQVKKAHELWFEANTRSNSRKQREKEAAAALEIDDDDDGETDLSDIDKLFNEKGRGPHLLMLDFEPETEEPVEYTSSTTGSMTRAWPWRHKLVAGVVARRYPTQSKKGWDTGVFSNKLRSITPSHSKVAYERAVYILKLNTKSNKAASTVCGVPAIVDRQSLLRQWVSCVVRCFFFLIRSND